MRQLVIKVLNCVEVSKFIENKYLKIVEPISINFFWPCEYC